MIFSQQWWTTITIILRTITAIVTKHWRLTTIMIMSLLSVLTLIYMALLALYAWKGIKAFDHASIVQVEKLVLIDFSVIFLVIAAPLLFGITVVSLFFEAAATTIYIHELDGKPHSIIDGLSHAATYIRDIITLAWIRTLMAATEEGFIDLLIEYHLSYLVQLPQHKERMDPAVRLLLVEPLILNEGYSFTAAAAESEKEMLANYGEYATMHCSFTFWDSTFLIIMVLALFVERIMYHFHDYVTSIIFFATIALSLITIVWMSKSLLRASIYQYLRNRPTGIFDAQFISSLITRQ